MARPTKLSSVARPATPAIPATATTPALPARPARTVQEVIVEHAQLGAPITDCALAAGLSKVTIHAWLKEAARAIERQMDGEKLSAHEKRLVEFLNSFEAAQARASATDRAIHQELTQRGGKTTTTTTRQRAGQQVETTTTVVQHPPSARGLEWRIEQRAPKRLEVSGPDGGPIPLTAVPPRDEMLDKLERLKREADELAKQRAKHDAIEAGEAS